MLLNPNNKLNYWENIFSLYKHAHIKLRPELELQMWQKILWIVEDVDKLSDQFMYTWSELQTVLGNWSSLFSHSELIMNIKNRIKELQDGKK